MKKLIFTSMCMQYIVKTVGTQIIADFFSTLSNMRNLLVSTTSNSDTYKYIKKFKNLKNYNNS